MNKFYSGLTYSTLTKLIIKLHSHGGKWNCGYGSVVCIQLKNCSFFIGWLFVWYELWLFRELKVAVKPVSTIKISIAQYIFPCITRCRRTTRGKVGFFKKWYSIHCCLQRRCVSLLSTSRYPHLKFVIQIPGLSKLLHFHSIKQQPTGAWATLSVVIFRFLAESLDNSNNVNGKKYWNYNRRNNNSK